MAAGGAGHQVDGAGHLASGQFRRPQRLQNRQSGRIRKRMEQTCLRNEIGHWSSLQHAPHDGFISRNLQMMRQLLAVAQLSHLSTEWVLPRRMGPPRTPSPKDDYGGYGHPDTQTDVAQWGILTSQFGESSTTLDRHRRYVRIQRVRRMSRGLKTVEKCVPPDTGI